MKCIYALYTKQYPKPLWSARYGHWADPKVEFLILAYSSKKSKEFFGKTCLVTDAYGKELVDEFGIEFDEIKVELDNCETKPRFWAAGKIHAYTKSVTDFGDGFIMCDNDAGFREKPPAWVTDSDYLCQHIHNDTHPMFYPLLRKIVAETPNVYPYDIFHECIKDPKGGNAGFVVLRDKEVWEEFSRYTWDLMNSEFFDRLEADFKRKKHDNMYRAFSLWNVLVEEILLMQCYRRLRGKLPNKLFDITAFDFPPNHPNPTNYFHIWGSKRKIERLKKDEAIAVEFIDEKITNKIYKYFNPLAQDGG